MVPGEDGPTRARDRNGAAYDLFEVLDSLNARFGRIYAVDLDGIEENRPQLDYLQEIARDGDVWLDAGSRTADEAIDALVTGASKAVLSTSSIRSPEEVRKAWQLSSALAFEIELRGGAVASSSAPWRGRSPIEVAKEVRSVGVTDLILSPRDGAIDWGMVATLAREGPTWVGGVFEASETGQLAPSGAAGGIFHLGTDLIVTTEGSPWSTFRPSTPGARDDET